MGSWYTADQIPTPFVRSTWTIFSYPLTSPRGSRLQNLQENIDVGVAWLNFHAPPVTLLKRRLQKKCFPVNFAKFLRIHILKSICKRLLLPSLLVWPKEWFGVRDFYELFTFQNKKVSLTKKVSFGRQLFMFCCLKSSSTNLI